MEPLFDSKEASLFDAPNSSWLGSASQDVSFCGIGPGSHIDSFAQWLKTGKQLTFGASGPAAITYQHPMVMKNVLGANLRVISGYGGTSDITLAVERGEVDGICGMFVSSISAQFKPMLDSGEMRLIIQMGPRSDEISARFRASSILRRPTNNDKFCRSPSTSSPLAVPSWRRPAFPPIASRL